MIKIIEDLKTGDNCKKQNLVLDSTVNILTAKNLAKDTIIEHREASIADQVTIIGNNKTAIEALTKENNRVKTENTILKVALKVYNYSAIIAGAVVVYVVFIK
jgi:hydroxymethylpyrimidine/phosphomethylpyrimidine kinase